MEKGQNEPVQLSERPKKNLHGNGTPHGRRDDGGVLFHGEPDWLRVYTNDLGLASEVAFLLPDEEISLEVQGRFRQGRHTWYRLVRVMGEPISAVDARQNGPE